MLNTASWVAGGKEALIKMKASENVQHQFREFRFSVQGADGTELELKPKLHQFVASDIVNTFYVVFAAENNSNNIFATSNQINVIEPYSLAENEYLARVTVSNHGKAAIFSGPTSLFELANAGHYTWASYQPDPSGADPAIHVQFSADKDPGKITKVKVTARYKRADLLSYNGFTKAIEGATVLEVPLTMDISHKDEESGKVYVNISATGSEAQMDDVAAGVQESKDYTDEKLSELLDSLYPPVNGTTTLTVYASGNKTWWHFNSLEIYLASGQRLYPLYYENLSTGTGVNQIKLIFTKDPNASLTLQNTAFFDTYELKDGEYSGALLTAESFGQTTTQSNNASSNIFSTDNYGLYVVPTASESAAFGIEITGELQQIAKISLRSPRQSSYVPPKIRATCVFDDKTLNAPEVETNSDISATFVFPFAEKSESEDIDLSNYVTLDGAETITGVKTFAATPVITNPPAADTDAVNKAYVDKAIQDAALEGGEIDTSKLVTTDTAQSITGAKSFTAPVTVATPTAGTHAATKDYVDQALETALEEGGAAGDLSNFVTLDGAQTISGKKTFSAIPTISGTPAANTDAVNKQYVDSAVAQKVEDSLSSGGSVNDAIQDAISDLNLSKYVTTDTAQSITGVKTFSAAPKITPAPSDDTDAANKAYVDSKVQGVTSDLGIAADPLAIRNIDEFFQYSQKRIAHIYPNIAPLINYDKAKTNYVSNYALSPSFNFEISRIKVFLENYFSSNTTVSSGAPTSALSYQFVPIAYTPLKTNSPDLSLLYRTRSVCSFYMFGTFLNVSGTYRNSSFSFNGALVEDENEFFDKYKNKSFDDKFTASAGFLGCAFLKVSFGSGFNLNALYSEADSSSVSSSEITKLFPRIFSITSNDSETLNQYKVRFSSKTSKYVATAGGSPGVSFGYPNILIYSPNITLELIPSPSSKFLYVTSSSSFDFFNNAILCASFNCSLPLLNQNNSSVTFAYETGSNYDANTLSSIGNYTFASKDSKNTINFRLNGPEFYSLFSPVVLSRLAALEEKVKELSGS